MAASFRQVPPNVVAPRCGMMPHPTDTCTPLPLLRGCSCNVYVCVPVVTTPPLLSIMLYPLHHSSISPNSNTNIVDRRSLKRSSRPPLADTGRLSAAGDIEDCLSLTTATPDWHLCFRIARRDGEHRIALRILQGALRLSPSSPDLHQVPLYPLPSSILSPLRAQKQTPTAHLCPLQDVAVSLMEAADRAPVGKARGSLLAGAVHHA